MACNETSGYCFALGLTVPSAAYCDDIALTSGTHEGIQDLFQKLTSFCMFAGLEINPAKSVYTYACAATSAKLEVSDASNPVACPEPLTHLMASGHYKYMGVHLSLTLDWTQHQAYLTKKTHTYQKLIRHKRLTTSNCITVANMVTTAYVSYSMGIVTYPDHWLCMLQAITLTTLKKAMRLPANVDNEPFFMSMQGGGRGLVNLIDLNRAVTCALTYQEINGHSLSHHTTTAAWNLA
jgi:hypothetical protein